MSKTPVAVVELRINIRKHKKRLALLQRDKQSDAESLQQQKEKLESLLEKYSTLTGGEAYDDTNDEKALDFCEEFFLELDRKTRNLLTLSRFYEKDCVLNVIGQQKYEGGEVVMNSIMAKFQDLSLKHDIIKVEVNGNEPSGSKRGLAVQCTVKLTVDTDPPRKVLYIFDLRKSSDKTMYPLAIKYQHFLVQDSRPLYHWPECPVPETKHDNWEPQFKPKVDEAAVAAAKAAEEAEAQKAAEEAAAAERAAAAASDDEDDDEEEDDEEVELEDEDGGGDATVTASAAGAAVVGNEEEDGDVDRDDAQETGNSGTNDNKQRSSGKSSNKFKEEDNDAAVDEAAKAAAGAGTGKLKKSRSVSGKKSPLKSGKSARFSSDDGEGDDATGDDANTDGRGDGGNSSGKSNKKTASSPLKKNKSSKIAVGGGVTEADADGAADGNSSSPTAKLKKSPSKLKKAASKRGKLVVPEGSDT